MDLQSSRMQSSERIKLRLTPLNRYPGVSTPPRRLKSDDSHSAPPRSSLTYCSFLLFPSNFSILWFGNQQLLLLLFSIFLGFGMNREYGPRYSHWLFKKPKCKPKRPKRSVCQGIIVKSHEVTVGVQTPSVPLKAVANPFLGILHLSERSSKQRKIIAIF